jgi:hypothetical protein
MLKLHIMKALIEQPRDDRTGEIVCSFMTARFVTVDQVEKLLRELGYRLVPDGSVSRAERGLLKQESKQA